VKGKRRSVNRERRVRGYRGEKKRAGERGGGRQTGGRERGPQLDGDVVDQCCHSEG